MPPTLAALVLLEVRPYQNCWKISEANHTALVFLKKPHALFAAHLRARNRRCEIHIFDGRGRLEETVEVDESKRMKAGKRPPLLPETFGIVPAATPKPRVPGKAPRTVKAAR